MAFRHNFDEFIDRKNTDSKKYDPNHYPADVIPMWIADTDFRCPQPIIDALAQRVQEGLYGYVPVSGRLKQAACKWEWERFGFPVSPEEVEFVPGVVRGILSVIAGFTYPGDKVVIQTPAYPPFTAVPEDNGRRVLRNELILENGRYRPDYADFEKKCADPRTKLFILCNPQNPTGRVFSKEELVRLGEICLKHNVLIVSDEIHCDLAFKPAKHIPFASLSERFAQSCITMINPSKTFNIPGFRTAAAITKNPAIRSRLHETLAAGKATGENVFGTLAFCTAYEQCGSYADQLVDYLAENVRLLNSAVAQIPGMELIKPEGTYLMWLNCRGLNLPQAQLMARFIHEAKVGVQDGIEFGPEGAGFVRMNIACPKCTLRHALDQMQAVFNKT